MLGLGLGLQKSTKLGGFIGLLDLVPNAAAAYSVRLLRKNYSGGLVRVIAYDGSTQYGAADVMPYNTGDGFWVDLNSPLETLDATATGRGLTTSSTLADLCSAGVNNYDGLVTTFYGQNSTSPIDATQLSLSFMPRIVNSGVLEVENGRPALKPQSASVIMSFPSFAAANYQIQVVGNSSGDNGSFVSGGDSGDDRFDFGVRTTSDTRILVSESGVSESIDTSSDYTNQQILLIGNQQQLRVNGSQVSTGTITNELQSSVFSFTLFKRQFGVTVVGGSLNLQEVVIYDSDKNSEILTIESITNNAFNIY